MHRWLLLIGALVATTGCFDPKLDDAGFACGESGCPPGAVCDGEGVCRADLPDTGENVVLALARAGQASQLFAFCDGAVRPWRALDDVRAGRAVAWGDPDGDGEPSLALANLEDSVRVVSVARGGVSQSSPVSCAQARAAAWGDQDRDGDVDLAISDHTDSLEVQRYQDGVFELVWNARGLSDPFGIDWGDVDGDADLDLAVATATGTVVLRNDGTTFTSIWTSPFDEGTRGVQWVDVDGDGDLDLGSVGRNAPARLFRNDRGALVAAWASPEANDGEALDWGDVDGDGDRDLAVASRDEPSRVYRNDGGALVLVWTASQALDSWSADWFDVDGDGDLDLTLGNRARTSRVLRNEGGALVDWLELLPDVRGLSWARWPVPAGDASACDAARW